MASLFALIGVMIVLGIPIAALVTLVRLSVLSRRLERLERGFEALERNLRGAEAARPAAPSPAPAVTPVTPIPPVVAPPIVIEPPSTPPPPKPREPGLEARLATRWFNVAGIVTLLFGVAFFLKYAYENAWIGPRGRVAIGVLVGLAAILLGERSRRRGHRVFSQGLVGGGLGALYLSFFFAFRLYQLIEVGPAFVLMAAVTALGLALALAQESQATAILAFLGAYLTPVLLSTGQDRAGFLFTYLAILALGALGTTWFRRWRALDLLAFAGTLLLYTGWHVNHYQRERLGVAAAGVAAFFIIFLVIPYGHALARRRMARPADHALALGNAAFAFGFLYRMIHPISDRALGFIALAMAAAYVTMMSPARRRSPEDKGLLVALGALGVLFLTLAIPLQLGLHGITLAWAAEGLLLVVLGFRYGASLTRWAGLAVLGLSVGRLFLFHFPLHEQPFTLIWNAPFGTWLLVCVAMAAAASFYRRSRGELVEFEPGLPSAGAVAVCFVSFVAMVQEAWLYPKLWEMGEGLASGIPLIAWCAGSLAIFAAGERLEDDTVRGTAFLLGAFSLAPFARVCARIADAPDPLFGSFEFWSGLAPIGACFAAAAWLRRSPAPGGSARDSRWTGLLMGAGGVLLLVLLTVEVHSHFGLAPAQGEEAMAARSLAALLSVSVLWAIYASVLLVLGLRGTADAGGPRRGLRVAAALLFGLTLGKVYLLDVWELRQGYRILSFVVLGLLLVGASFLYSRFRARLSTGALLVVISGLAGGHAEAAFDSSRWSHYREIRVEGEVGPAQPFAMVTLDAEALATCRGDLADVRIVGRNGLEIPWADAAERGGLLEESLSPEILNRVTGPSGRVSVELDFGAPARCNRLVLGTDGSSFRRRVRVEGRDASGRWATLVEEAWLLRQPATADFPGAVSDAVTLPDNDFSRLRISVEPTDDEEGARHPVVIDRVSASSRRTRPAETVPLKIAWSGPARLAESATSALEIDLGHVNARPVRLVLEIADRIFFRPFVLQGRSGPREVARRGKTETGEWVERDIEVPWQVLASGVLARRTGDEKLEVGIAETPVRQLRLILADGDSPPLTVRGVAVQGQSLRLVFAIAQAGPWRLYCGNPEATMPSYDLSRALPDVRGIQSARASLGPMLPNPAVAPPAEAPFSERYAWALWIVTLGAILVLALLVRSNLRRPGQG